MNQAILTATVTAWLRVIVKLPFVGLGTALWTKVPGALPDWMVASTKLALVTVTPETLIDDFGFVLVPLTTASPAVVNRAGGVGVDPVWLTPRCFRGQPGRGADDAKDEAGVSAGVSAGSGEVVAGGGSLAEAAGGGVGLLGADAA